jgi:transcriptional regulator with XRE-family HTH domain
MSDQEQPGDLERARWKQFGTWLRELRLAKGVRQIDIAAAAKVGIQSLTALERGGFRRYDDGPWLVPNPKDETLIALARALGVEVEEMYRRVGRYEDRPATKGSRRRTDRSSSRLATLERQNAELERRLRVLEERIASYGEPPQAARPRGRRASE